MKLKPFFLFISALCLFCNTLYAGSFDLRVTSIDGVPFQGGNDIDTLCIPYYNTVTFDLVYISDPNWKIDGFSCFIIRSEETGEFDISQAYFPHPWDLGSHLEITDDGDIWATASNLFSPGVQGDDEPVVILADLISRPLDWPEYDLDIILDGINREYEVSGSLWRDITVGDGFNVAVIDDFIWAADFDGNQFIDFEDLALFAQHWLTSYSEEGYSSYYDLNWDDKIDFDDLCIFHCYWQCHVWDCHCMLGW